MKNNGFATKFGADPLDKRLRGAKTGADWRGLGTPGEAQIGGAGGTAFALDFAALTARKEMPKGEAKERGKTRKGGAKRRVKKEPERAEKGRKGAKKLILGRFFDAICGKIC